MLGFAAASINNDFWINMARGKVPVEPTQKAQEAIDPHPAAGDDTAATSEQFLSAKDAAQLLRIKPQTLYAYVSRGWLHSTGHDKRRGYLYRRDDVERLRARGRARAEGGLYKSGAPRWSEPIVQTTITAISPAGPVFRGHSALELARRGHSFESVAELLWSGVWTEDRAPWQEGRTPLSLDALIELVSAGVGSVDIIKLFSMLVMSLAARGSEGDDLREGNTIVAARRLLTSLPGCIGYLTPAGHYTGARSPSAEGGASLAGLILASAGVPTTSAATRAVNAALVLLADHELTPQTFAARLAASSGASLYFCVLSALSAHSGSRIRRACDKVEDLVTTAETTVQLRDRLAGELSAHPVPGFDHPLYPDGDPRAAYLLELARELGDQNNGSANVGVMIDQAAIELRARPSVEAGLVALCHALEFPRGSAGALLTISRCAGWMAHVIEQRLAGVMLRPRARFKP
jgi:citrate synthase